MHPHAPPQEWCNNDRKKGNDCAVGLKCGGRPPFVDKRKSNDFCNTYYSPLANSGNCCDKLTRTVKTGKMYSTPDARGYMWCQAGYVRDSRRRLLSQSQFAYPTERSSGPWGAHGAPGAKWNAGADDDAESISSSARLGGEVDTYGIKKQCEAKPRCVGFKISGSGCVTFMLSSSTEELPGCREASVEIDYGVFKPEEAYWDGDIVGTVSLSTSDLASLPALEGTVSAAVAWRKPPGEPVSLVGSVMVKATATLRVGPVTAPTIMLQASAAFPVPCMFGHEVQAAGILAINNLGGFLSMDVFASFKYHCGVTGAGLLAEIRAGTNKVGRCRLTA